MWTSAIFTNVISFNRLLKSDTHSVKFNLNNGYLSEKQNNGMGNIRPLCIVSLYHLKKIANSYVILQS